MNDVVLSRARLQLLGGFGLMCDGLTVRVALGARRLLAYLALAEAGANRAVSAEDLWPDSPQGRANANLRSALWQVRKVCGPWMIEIGGQRLRLSPDVGIDLPQARRKVREVIDAPPGRPGADVEELVDVLSRGLLVDWMDEWLLVDRERWDHVRLHALEMLARHLLSTQRYLPALQAASAAVAIEPVRESAHRTIVEIYIAEGNPGSALKYYQRYRCMLQRELGVAPSRQMARLVHSLVPA